MLLVNLMGFLKGHGRVGRRSALAIERGIQHHYGCYISRRAQIASNVVLPHPTGIVIGEGAVIGAGCMIFQNVTIGAPRIGGAARGLYPEIEAGVTIFAGAVIVGAIRVGSGATIGANAVVLSDVPAGALAVGIPARILPVAKNAASLISDGHRQ